MPQRSWKAAVATVALVLVSQAGVSSGVAARAADREAPSLAAAATPAQSGTAAVDAQAAGAADLQRRLDAATRVFIESREELAGVDAELRSAQRQVDENAKLAQAARATINQQAAALYRAGGMDTAALVLGQEGGDVTDLVDRLALAGQLTDRAQDNAAEATAVLSNYNAATKRLAAARARQQTLVARQQAAVGQLQSDLATAKERLERERAAERERLAREQAAAKAAQERAAAARQQSAPPQPSTTSPPAPSRPPAVSANGRACPVEPPYSYIDSWGAARSGGRRHEGVDIMAPHGATVYAHRGGTVTKTTINEGLGGTTVWIRDAAGTLYYYAHLSRLGARTGQQVRTGAVIGAVGSTGNASASAPHLHFEVRPGGSPVNPYPFVKSVCG
jgi:peptidoglycan LD-endopeptidase LytH